MVLNTKNVPWVRTLSGASPDLGTSEEIFGSKQRVNTLINRPSIESSQVLQRKIQDASHYPVVE